MRQLKQVLFVFCLFGFCSCNNHKYLEETGSLKNIHIDLDNLEKGKPLEDCVEEVSFIPLETTDSCLIQMISGLKIVDHRIYVRDNSQGCVFVFDENGKYKFKLDRLGRGPDEYTHLLGFCVDQRHIIVRGFSELVLYDKNNGDFVKKIHIPMKDFIPARVYADSSFYYFLTADGFSNTNIQATVVAYDKDTFSLKKAYMDPFYYKEHPHTSSTVFINSPFGLLFHQVLNDTLYRLGKEELEPLFFLNVGKYQFTYEKYENAPLNSNKEKAIPNKAIFPIDDIYFMDKYLCFTCYQKTTDPVKYDVFWCFYSLETGEVKVFDENKFYGKNKYSVNFFSFDASDHDGYCYTICYPSLITYFRDVKKKVLDERYGTMKAEDNPWLMKYRLKL